MRLRTAAFPTRRPIEIPMRVRTALLGAACTPMTPASNRARESMIFLKTPAPDKRCDLRKLSRTSLIARDPYCVATHA